MSRNTPLDNISKTYIKQLISKNSSKISDTGSMITTSQKNSKHKRRYNKILYNPKNISASTSKCLSTNNNSIIRKEQTLNPLITVYNNTYYPRSYKNKNFIKEMKRCLPPITMNNEISSSKVLITDYDSSINRINNIYRIKGDELEINKDSDEEELVQEIKKNKIDFNESTYINKVLKNNQKQNLFITFRNKEEFSSPKNSLLTLKINKALIKNISESISKYQYQSYAKKINDRQTYRLKLCIMPKANIKQLKYSLELNKQKDSQLKRNSVIKDSTKKIVTLNKGLMNKITKKYNSNQINLTQAGAGNQETSPEKKNKSLNKKKSKSDIYLNITDENMPEGNKKNTINSTLIRNALIVDVKLYYCKYIMQGTSNPTARIEATFTSYLNNIYLFGGLQSNDVSDLWILNIGDKLYTWKKIFFEKDIKFNTRYGHTTVLFNDCLYIYGGRFNLKKLKYPLEDILVYNIHSNVMKIGTFKNERNILSRKYIYIPIRRNHIAHVIGWNMIVHGGIDNSRENIQNSYQDYYDDVNHIQNQSHYRKMSDNAKINETNNNTYISNNSHILGDFMALDLITFKWMKLENIVFKKKNSKKLYHFKSLPRVYHSSCLVLSIEHLVKGNKINIYKNDLNSDEDENVLFQNGILETKQNFDIKYEGIYMFGGLDENFKETNNLYILHCFRNPLVLFEPKINGIPPRPRQMASMNFNKILNYITIYGGKNINQVFGDLFVLDIMNFQWINVELFGASIKAGINGHSSNIINDKLFIFGGCDENNKYIKAKLLCIELDLFRNKKLAKIYEYAMTVLADNPKDKTAINVLELMKGGLDLPPDIYPFLQLDN